MALSDPGNRAAGLLDPQAGRRSYLYFCNHD
jgi:hypothetical protein